MTPKTSSESARTAQEAPNEYSYAALLGIETSDVFSVVKAVSEGLPYKALEICSRNLKMTKEDLSVILGIPKRTLARRKLTQRLRPDESDRLLRLSRIVAMAVALFDGNNEAAREWLSSPQYALGNATPLDFSSTDVGARAVETVIVRLEHGVPV